MRKSFIILTVALVAVSLTSCEYDDSDLWNDLNGIKNRVTVLEKSVVKTNEDIVALQSIVNALQKNVYVTSVKTNADAYTITFSDGQTATISNGKDGKDGTNAPVVSVKQETDGNYYWTLDGEWLLVDGEKVRANGQDGTTGSNGQNGEDGKDAIAPQVRINDTTKEWEISTDGGNTWTSTGVVAEGKDGANGSNGTDGADGANGANGDSLFKSVDTSNPDYVIITLNDGTSFKLARYDESVPSFVIENAAEVVEVEYGKSVELAVTTANVSDYTINTPEGWRVEYDNNMLTVTAPQKDLCHYDKEGVVAVSVVSEAGKSAIVKFNVFAGEWVEEVVLRTLTFEDADAKFAPYTLDYAGIDITTWSNLIDSPQYGGPLTYGDYTSAMYTWWDENNTELMHIFPSAYDTYCYWSGGHAISNYWGEGFSNEDRNKHIATYYGEDYVEQWAGNDQMLGWMNVQLMNPIGAYSGDNFCVHFGYIDFMSMVENLPEIMFADGEARVIDHMYVTNTNYVLNQLMCGVSSEAGNTFGGAYTGPTEESWYKIIAQGYATLDDEEPTSEVEFYLMEEGEPVLDWQEWDLSELGAVVRVQFNMAGSDDMGGQYGLTIPAYFAYDDVAVQFIEKVFK